VQEHQCQNYINTAALVNADNLEDFGRGDRLSSRLRFNSLMGKKIKRKGAGKCQT
jgi:hypothetical protein